MIKDFEKTVHHIDSKEYADNHGSVDDNDELVLFLRRVCCRAGQYRLPGRPQVLRQPRLERVPRQAEGEAPGAQQR